MPMKPPLQGVMVNRGSKKEQPTEESGADELVSGTTNFLDGVLRVFEGIGPERAKFSFVEITNTMPCGFCGEPTCWRLVVTRRGEEARTVMCDVCKEAIGQA